jgi:hypothetical protein
LADFGAKIVDDFREHLIPSPHRDWRPGPHMTITAAEQKVEK